MAAPDAQDAATKARIIKHMNNDHADSIRRYLEAFKKQSFFQVRDARMIDITLESTTLECSGKTHIIPFDPPLSTFGDARGRLVALDKSALQTLCRSDISLANTPYVPPYAHLGHFLNFAHGFIVWTIFSRAAKFAAGSLVYDLVLSHVPAVAGVCAAIRSFYFPFIVSIHLFEGGLYGSEGGEAWVKSIAGDMVGLGGELSCGGFYKLQKTRRVPSRGRRGGRKDRERHIKVNVYLNRVGSNRAVYM